MEQNLEYFLAQIKANQLSELNLSNKKLTDTQVIRLAEALKHSQSLTTLDLGWSRLAAAGAEKLCEALTVNRTLTTLYLCYNQLGVAGAEKLCEALKVNQTLTTLYLYNNQLGAAGAEKLSEALKVNQTLTTLDLVNNQLGVAGAEKLSEALKVNRTLTSLKVNGNELDNATVHVIQKALQTNIERIKSTRNQTLLILVILLRHAHSSQSTLPLELWELIMKQLDFPSVKRGYRTSHALVSFLSQRNIFVEFNQRLQTQQNFRLIKTRGTKLSESRFSFLTPQTILLSGAANTISQASHEDAEPQIAYFKNK